MATYREVNSFLLAKGLAKLPIPPDKTLDDEVEAQTGAAGASFEPTGVADALGQIPQPAKKPRKRKAPSQPKWKWSWDPTEGLLIWSVDSRYGQPHHIEVTGPDFYNLAQGRVYVDWDGNTEILVWADRASEEWQDMAVEDVDNWLIAHTGKPSDEVYYSSEGGFYPKIKPGQTPAKDKMIQTYFQVDKSKMTPQKWMELSRSYDQILQTYDPTAPKPEAVVTPQDYRGRGAAPKAVLDAPVQENTKICMECHGDGLIGDETMLCPRCHGTGYEPE